MPYQLHYRTTANDVRYQTGESLGELHNRAKRDDVQRACIYDETYSALFTYVLGKLVYTRPDMRRGE